MEGSIPDAGNAVRDRDARQALAALEGSIPDAGDAIRDRDTRQAAGETEGPIPDAGDRITFNRLRNYQLAGSGLITIGYDDFSVIRGVSQVIQSGSVERLEGTDKDRKKGLERFHYALALPHVRRQVKLETG